MFYGMVIRALTIYIYRGIYLPLCGMEMHDDFTFYIRLFDRKLSTVISFSNIGMSHY